MRRAERGAGRIAPPVFHVPAIIPVNIAPVGLRGTDPGRGNLSKTFVFERHNRGHEMRVIFRSRYQRIIKVDVSRELDW